MMVEVYIYVEVYLSVNLVCFTFIDIITNTSYMYVLARPFMSEEDHRKAQICEV